MVVEEEAAEEVLEVMAVKAKTMIKLVEEAVASLVMVEMLQAVQEQYAATVEKLAILKDQDKTKTATYRQLLGDKLMLQNILSLYRIYGLLD